MRCGLNTSKNTGKLDRHAQRAAHRQRRATARITIELGQNHTGQTDCVMEALRDLHRFLTDHRIDDEQNFGRLGDCLDAPQLIHELVIDLQPARRIEDQYAVPLTIRLFERRRRDLRDILLIPVRVNRNVDLLAERLQLIDCCRALHVQRRQHR
jgi:hypothetical protein